MGFRSPYSRIAGISCISNSRSASPGSFASSLMLLCYLRQWSGVRVRYAWRRAFGYRCGRDGRSAALTQQRLHVDDSLRMIVLHCHFDGSE